jgi:RNA polymerase sigma-70 factor (TIGR02960 family)
MGSRPFFAPIGVIACDGERRNRSCEDLAVSERVLTRAAKGDEKAFRELTDPYVRELRLHCYRILGSMHDAEDVLQETLLAAWRGLAGFEERASLRAWLYRIATNRALNALRDAARRPPRSVDLPFAAPEPTRVSEPTGLEPYPDFLLEGIVDDSPGPETRYETRETVELAFIAALQRLSPRQRAALMLRDVLGFHAGEVAAMLDTSEDSVKSALKRARATLEQSLPQVEGDRPPSPGSPGERELVKRFADAFVADDIDGVVTLLTEDAWLAMPPVPLEYQGPTAIGGFLRELAAWRGARCYRLLATRANSQPAFACYRTDPDGLAARATGLFVLTLRAERISAITQFLDPGIVDRFGLPLTLPADGAP